MGSCFVGCLRWCFDGFIRCLEAGGTYEAGLVPGPMGLVMAADKGLYRGW